MAVAALNRAACGKLTNALSRLSMDVWLLDEAGKNILEGFVTAAVVPALLVIGRPEVVCDKTWLMVNEAGVSFVVVHGIDDAAVDCAFMTQSLLHAIVEEAPAYDRNSSLRSVLLDEMQPPLSDVIAADNHIPLELLRVVIVFHCSQSSSSSAAELMSHLIPLEDDDMLVDVNRSTLALVKSLATMEHFDDVLEYGFAVEQTIATETALKFKIAVGEPRNYFGQLAESYKEAWRALMVGHIYKPDQSVYLFRKLSLERFIMETPREISQRYHHLLFNRKTQRLFNEEMLHTLQMFFDKDLNLSDASRQLYIHRNTLVYRLDKVQRQTGLDLRRFDDAITFQMLFMMGRGGREYNPQPAQQRHKTGPARGLDDSAGEQDAGDDRQDEREPNRIDGSTK